MICRNPNHLNPTHQTAAPVNRRSASLLQQRRLNDTADLSPTYDNASSQEHLSWQALPASHNLLAISTAAAADHITGKQSTH